MKIKKIALLAVITMASIGAYAQKKVKEPFKEKRVSNTYRHINIQGEMDVLLIQNEKPGVEVEGSVEQVKNTVTMLRGDTLYIYPGNGEASRSMDKNKVVVKINIEDILTLEVNGKTKVESQGYLKSDLFTIKSDGGAEIKIDVKAEKS